LKILVKLARIVDVVSGFAGFLAAVLTVGVFGIILTEVIARSFFNFSTLIADEYSSYFFVGLAYLGWSYILRREKHIRVRILLSRLSPSRQKVLNIVCSAIACAFLSYFSLYSLRFAMESYSTGTTAPTPAETPLFIPQSVLFVGVFLLLLQFVAHIIYDIDSLINSNDHPQMQ